MKLLDNVRVIDLTNVLAGPFGTMHLALLGAEVIKIENPDGGDLARKLGNVPGLNQVLMGTSFWPRTPTKIPDPQSQGRRGKEILPQAGRDLRRAGGKLRRA
jgi:hypothetical protein